MYLDNFNQSPNRVDTKMYMEVEMANKQDTLREDLSQSYSANPVRDLHCNRPIGHQNRIV